MAALATPKSNAGPGTSGKASSAAQAVAPDGMHATVTAAPGSRLLEFPGIGEALAQRIVKEFGSEDAFLAAAKAMEVDRLSAVEGISVRKAVEIVLQVQGRRPLDFLKTPRAETLYEDVLARIAEFACTDYARNRVQLLVPMQDAKEIEKHVAWVLAARDRAAALPREPLARLLKRVGKPRTPRPKFDSSLAVLVDTEQDYEALVALGLDKHCQVMTPEDSSFNDGFEVVVYAYSLGTLDLTGADNVVQVPFQRDLGALAPRATLHWFAENRGLFEAVGEIARILEWKSVVPQVLATLDRLGAREVDFTAIDALVRKVADEINADVKRRMQDVSLAGDEVLDMMGGRTPKRVLALQGEALRAARDRIMRETGDDFQVFTEGFPVRVDDDALEKRRLDYVGRKKRGLFREEVEAAHLLAKLKPQLETEVQRALELDYELALGAFALAYGLSKPKLGKSFTLQGALHLNLVRAKGQRIDYEIGAPDNVVLLTGANSGGKTTLLETVAQACILAHLGLPVNAEEATVDLVDSLYFFTQKRSLDAGAFESFLRGFIPIVTSPSKKLVLADELEAMTELDAASKIVGTFIELLHASKSYGVCVSHMADEVSKHTRVRVDGIEAKGLDEDFNLVVDRTPRMNYRARSTPELILQRLANRAGGEERKVYEMILKKFA